MSFSLLSSQFSHSFLQRHSIFKQFMLVQTNRKQIQRRHSQNNYNLGCRLTIKLWFLCFLTFLLIFIFFLFLKTCSVPYQEIYKKIFQLMKHFSNFYSKLNINTDNVTFENVYIHKGFHSTSFHFFIQFV